MTLSSFHLQTKLCTRKTYCWHPCSRNALAITFYNLLCQVSIQTQAYGCSTFSINSCSIAYLGQRSWGQIPPDSIKHMLHWCLFAYVMDPALWCNSLLTRLVLRKEEKKKKVIYECPWCAIWEPQFFSPFYRKSHRHQQNVTRYHWIHAW